MFLAKLYRAPGPHISVRKTSQVLMGPGKKAEHGRETGNAKRSDLFFDSRICQRHGALQQRDCFVMLSRQVMKSSFNGEGVRGFQWISFRIKHQQRLVHIIETALIAVSNERTRSLTLNARAFARIVGQGQRPVEMRRRPQTVARGEGGVPRCFLEHELLTLEAERLSTLKRATVSGDGFVVGKNSLSLYGRQFRVS